MKMSKLMMLPTVLLASLALAGTFTTQDVNTKIADLVAPFNNATTVLKMAFTTLDFDATKTLGFDLSGVVSKTGANNSAQLDFNSIRYTTTGGQPTLTVDVDAKMDFVKALGQDAINAYADELDAAVVDMAKDYTKDYGAAITLKATTTEKVVDTQGNVERMKVVLKGTLDPAQLPTTKPVTEAEFKSFDVVVTATRTGAHLDGSVVLNPQYKAFQAGQDGVKEYAEKLMADDAKTLDLVNYGLAVADSLGEWLVELKP